MQLGSPWIDRPLRAFYGRCLTLDPLFLIYKRLFREVRAELARRDKRYNNCETISKLINYKG